MENGEKPESKISNATAGLMIITAVFIDLLQFFLNLIPILGNILASCVGVLAFGTFYLWFKIRGINFSSPKKGLTLWAGALVDLIPLVNMLPAWTFVVVRLIIVTRAEEKLATVSPVLAKIGSQAAQKSFRKAV